MKNLTLAMMLFVAGFACGALFECDQFKRANKHLDAVLNQVNTDRYWENVSTKSLDLLWAIRLINDDSVFQNEIKDLPEFIDLQRYMEDNGDECIECFIGELDSLDYLWEGEE